jgi:hypothetical protein
VNSFYPSWRVPDLGELPRVCKVISHFFAAQSGLATGRLALADEVVELLPLGDSH